jgi:hypothetical protein
VEQRSCVFVSLVWQALGAWPSTAEIGRLVQAWRARPSRTEITHVCIPGVAGLAGKAQRNGDCVGLCRPEGMAWLKSRMSVDLWLGRP